MAHANSSGALNRRLGQGADARLLIINCDDLGSSHAANVAIHRAPGARELVDKIRHLAPS